jgi:Xaa-Pro aminopeptidase
MRKSPDMFTSHFQSFDDHASSDNSGARIDALRHYLFAHSLDGFIIPRADEHQNEYVPKNAERLAWLTGFTGSAGLAIVLPDCAAICVDGRYTLQVRQQIDSTLFDPIDLAHHSIEEWLATHLRAQMNIGFDPHLLTQQQWTRLNKVITDKGAHFIACQENPIDHIWHDRPSAPSGIIQLHPKKYAGEETSSKLARLYHKLDQKALLVSDPHNLCWLFNIRGSDVEHTPIVMGYALIQQGHTPRIYIDNAKLDATSRAYLSSHALICATSSMPDDLSALATQAPAIILDHTTCARSIHDHLTRNTATIDLTSDPITLLKACKNKTEIKGSIKAHVRDGVALVHFLSWLDNAVTDKKLSEIAKLSEIECAEALETYRRATKKLKDISFPTISAFGAQGASPHYRVTRSSNARLGKGFYLVDSGAQYEDGTTDVTRTIVIGTPTHAMREHYTRVLKGHIAIARAIFPAGTSGAQIDAFARAPLWEIGEDFDHGTGHGVGSYLSVHEGPQRISKFGAITLEEGMIISNEPAFYLEGAYGIRLENLIVVEKYREHKGSRPMLHFSTLTLAPFDLRAINLRLLNTDEKKWLNDYHQRVRTELMPLIDPEHRPWLKRATQKI